MSRLSNDMRVIEGIPSTMSSNSACFLDNISSIRSSIVSIVRKRTT